MPPRPLNVNALAQALANVRPPADAAETFVMWLACCRALASAMPEDFGHNFTLLCKTLAPKEQK